MRTAVSESAKKLIRWYYAGIVFAVLHLLNIALQEGNNYIHISGSENGSLYLILDRIVWLSYSILLACTVFIIAYVNKKSSVVFRVIGYLLAIESLFVVVTVYFNFSSTPIENNLWAKLNNIAYITEDSLMLLFAVVGLISKGVDKNLKRYLALIMIPFGAWLYVDCFNSDGMESLDWLYSACNKLTTYVPLLAYGFLIHYFHVEILRLTFKKKMNGEEQLV